MDRDKRRSKEEEEELDRKIALIREKNQKIEQRSKEVEADRASNTVTSSKKPSTPSQGQPAKEGSKNKVWDREWDQGKTPANQWRENVPSIEHSGRLANAAGQNRRRGQQGQGSTTETVEKMNKGRLEGRLTMDPEKAAGNKNRGGRREDQQLNNNKNRDAIVEKMEKTNGAPRQEQRNRRRGNFEKKTIENKESGDGSKEQNENQKKSRPRRENDRYAVRMVLKQLVDKVDKMERRRKRDEKRQNEESNPVEEQKTKSQLSSIGDPQKKENFESDANQNVIQLTRERVLTVQST